MIINNIKYLPLILVLHGCGGSNSTSRDANQMKTSDDTPSTETASSTSPSLSTDELGIIGPENSSEASILAFLQEGAWKSWTVESPIRPSVSAHGRMVQTFINRPLLGSLKGKNSVHPVGSAAVKVLYSSDGVTVNGYAFEQKTVAGNSGDSWIWYEGFAPNFQNSYYGQGLKLCASCHGSKGVDFVTVDISKASHMLK